jgi:hypothetical protein
MVASGIEPVSSLASTPAASTQPSVVPLDVLASEPDPVGKEGDLAGPSSNSGGIESSIGSPGQNAGAEAEKGSAETAGESRPLEDRALAGTGEEEPLQESSREAVVAGADREAVEEIFFRSFYAKTLLETREEAFLAVMQKWGFEGSGEDNRKLYRASPDLYKAARAFGFQCLRFRGNINRVRALNLPALMELRLGESLTKRYVALLAFEGPYGRIAPSLPDGSSLVPLEVLESFWYGTAHVLWRDVWGGRRYLAKGMKGEPIGRMQSSLKELGYYKQKPSGVFDEKTAAAVRAFQRAHFLDEDGILGPQTRIVLYQALQRFQMPALEGAS